MLLFNANNGYLEAILRGYRSGLISKGQYLNFTQCETLEDLKVQLASTTDHSEYFSSIPAPMKTAILGARLRESFVAQFRYLRENASSAGQLARFLDYVSLEWMIENVITMIRGSMRQQDRDEILARCHPLGMFDALPALALSRSMADLYSMVLVETPLAPYFRQWLAERKGDPQEDNDDDQLSGNVEMLRMGLHRAYLEDFYAFCTTGGMDSVTAETMGQLLAFQADRRTISIAVNALGTDLSYEDRLSLFPRFGQLWESGMAERLSRTDDLAQVRAIVEGLGVLPGLFDRQDVASGSSNTSSVSLDEAFFEREMELCKAAFDYQFCLTPFYAFVRMREQEIRNIVWIGECIAQRQKESIHHYIPLF